MGRVSDRTGGSGNAHDQAAAHATADQIKGSRHGRVEVDLVCHAFELRDIEVASQSLPSQLTLG
jgi:hypothetical protein